ncbi:MAG: MBL fold metallo-hydrolase [Gemmatimonadales bacterium]
MTALVVLGSGSQGNAFALVHDGAILLLDAGFSLREIDKRLGIAGLDPAMLVGVAITHEHGDHAAGATKLARRHSIPLLASMGTWRGVSRGGEPCEWLPLGSRGAAHVGPFTVSACATSHDAAEPIALGVVMPDGCSLGMATDLGRPTQAVRWFLRHRHCLVLEANHDATMLRMSGYPLVVQQRIAGPGGHLSNSDCAELLAEVHHEGLATVVLAHLSQRCNSAELARSAIESRLSAAGFNGELHLAVQDGPMASIALKSPVQGSLFR